jgi:LPS-assembly lipoprotein
MIRMHALLRCLLIMAALSLAACGFQLRGEVKLASNLQRVYVTSSDTYGPLKHNVEAALARAGAKIEIAPGEGIAQINMTGVGVTTVVASVGANARVNEFNMVYHVDLEISDGAGKTVLEKQPIEQTRSFTFDQTQAIGTGSEQDLIRREMERDMAQAIMRKIDSAERRLSP